MALRSKKIKGILATAFAAVALVWAAPSFAGHTQDGSSAPSYKSLQDQWSCYNGVIGKFKERKGFFERGVKHKSKDKIKKQQFMKHLIEESFPMPPEASPGSAAWDEVVNDRSASRTEGTWQYDYIENAYEALKENPVVDEVVERLKKKKHKMNDQIRAIYEDETLGPDLKTEKIHFLKSALESDIRNLILNRCFFGSSEPAAESIFSKFENANRELTGESYSPVEKNKFMAGFVFDHLLALQSPGSCVSQTLKMRSSDTKSVFSLSAMTCRVRNGRLLLNDRRPVSPVAVVPLPLPRS